MASSSKKTSKSNSDAKATVEADVVDAVVIEDADVAEQADVSGDVDEAVAEGVEAVEDTSVEDVAVVEPVLEPAKRANPFWGLLLGGLVAAALGFGLARYWVPEGWPWGTVELEATVAQQAERISELDGKLGDATSQITAQSDVIATLDARLAALVEQVNAEPEVGTAELPADLAALLKAQKDEISSLQGDLRSMAEFAEGQIETAQETAEAAARAKARATARDNLNQVRLALASGAAFEDALPQIAGAVDVPAALSDAAGGVVTQSALQDGFGAAARAALAASNRELAGDSTSERVSLFLQDIVGARSLTPQEGDSPDAVLSRVEAAVRNGDLGAALSTIDALPESGKAELTEWSEMAKARNDALQAFSDLTDALSAD